MDLKETGCEGVAWIHLAQDRVHWKALVKIVMNFKFQKDMEFLNQLTY
jgi:hypothetical protein